MKFIINLISDDFFPSKTKQWSCQICERGRYFKKKILLWKHLTKTHSIGGKGWKKSSKKYPVKLTNSQWNLNEARKAKNYFHLHQYEQLFEKYEKLSKLGEVMSPVTIRFRCPIEDCTYRRCESRFFKKIDSLFNHLRRNHKMILDKIMEMKCLFMIPEDDEEEHGNEREYEVLYIPPPEVIDCVSEMIYTIEFHLSTDVLDKYYLMRNYRSLLNNSFYLQHLPSSFIPLQASTSSSTITPVTISSIDDDLMYHRSMSLQTDNLPFSQIATTSIPTQTLNSQDLFSDTQMIPSTINDNFMMIDTNDQINQTTIPMEDVTNDFFNSNKLLEAYDCSSQTDVFNSFYNEAFDQSTQTFLLNNATNQTLNQQSLDIYSSYGICPPFDSNNYWVATDGSTQTDSNETPWTNNETQTDFWTNSYR
ncbi:hypothetical protein SNEBB_000527 [Seison nebaliae]|nr:hypothetical protein SNEBB_000527 [Seison nebaliae]